jgi:hypothetical protein
LPEGVPERLEKIVAHGRINTGGMTGVLRRFSPAAGSGGMAKLRSRFQVDRDWR